MDIDFSKLDGIAYTPRNAPESPSEPFLSEGVIIPPKAENPVQGNSEDERAINILKRQADINGAEKERALTVCRTYQQSLIAVSQMQAEILKGAAAGADIYDLFLKAVKALSLLTNDNVIYGEVERNVRAVYGIGLSEASPLSAELEEVEGRLSKLRAAAQNEKGDDLKRIQHAIAEHEARAAAIRAKTEE